MRWLLLSLLLLAPCANAIELLEALQNTPIPQGASPNDVQMGKYKILSMMVGCELNDKCVLLMLTEVVKHDPDPFYKAFLTTLEEQKDQIEKEAKDCAVKEMQAVKQAKTACVAIEIGKMKQAGAGTPINTYEESMNKCIKTNIENLATTQNNIFAQHALVNYYAKINNVPESQKWGKMIEAQKGTPAYQALEKCMQSEGE